MHCFTVDEDKFIPIQAFDHSIVSVVILWQLNGSGGLVYEQ